MTVQDLINKLQECNPTDLINFIPVIEGIGRDELSAYNADLILRKDFEEDTEINFVVLGQFEDC